MSTSTRLRKPMRKRMWMKSQASHATKPERWTPPGRSATAFLRPIVASEPLSRYSNGWPKIGLSCVRSTIACATYLPSCIAAGATPGTGAPSAVLTAARSPMTKTLGSPGALRVGVTRTRPALDRAARWSERASGEAATPAPHKTVRAAMRSSPDRKCTVTPWSSMPVTRASTCTCTPSCASCLSARFLQHLGIRRRGRAACLRAEGRAPGADRCGGSPRVSAWKATSLMAPASSTPVAPPPTTTKVSHCAA